MEEKNRQILIISDGTDSIQRMAADIKAVIEKKPDYSVKTMDVQSFAGNDLLPCCAFFLGCDTPKPSSFAYIDAFFRHINLIGRPCGLFSGNQAALEYLSALILDCEAVAKEHFLAQNDAADREKLQNWVQGVVSML